MKLLEYFQILLLAFAFQKAFSAHQFTRKYGSHCVCAYSSVGNSLAFNFFIINNSSRAYFSEKQHHPFVHSGLSTVGS